MPSMTDPEHDAPTIDEMEPGVPVKHPTGERQAAENEENEPPA